MASAKEATRREELSADAWVERVAPRQSGFDATQHQMSNHVVTPAVSSAACITYIVARHCLRAGEKDLIQVIGGYHTNRLIRSMTIAPED